MSNSVDRLIELVEEAPDKFNNRLPAIEKKMLDELLALLKNMQVRNGRIVSSAENLKIINSIKGRLGKLVMTKEYLKDLKEFAGSYNTAGQYANAYYAGVSDSFKPSRYYTAIKNAAMENAIDALTETGINANVINPIRNMLLTAVTTGQSYSSLTETLKSEIAGTEKHLGSLSRYASTYTVTALSQFTGQYMAAINRDLGFKWFRYLGSNIKTTREFCKHMTKKEWVHESEFEKVLSGDIDGHQCRIYETTGLPYGMIEGTNPTNFEANCGGWNCRHKMYGVPDYMVPENVRNRLKINDRFAGSKEEVDLIKRLENIKFDERYNSKNGGYLDIISQNKNESSKNLITYKFLADRGKKYALIPPSNTDKSPDAVNIEKGWFSEAKNTNSTNGKNIIQNSIKSAYKQGAKEVVINMSNDIPSRDLHEGLMAALQKDRAIGMKEIILIRNGREPIYLDVEKLRERFKRKTGG